MVSFLWAYWQIAKCSGWQISLKENPSVSLIQPFISFVLAP